MRKRIEELDIIKCLAIVLVVIGHTKCPQLIHNMCYSIHMPLFFMVSGCTLAGGDNIIVFIKKKLKSFYVPFLMFVIPICLLHNVFWEFGLYENRYSLHQYLIQMARCFAFSIGKNEPFLPQLWFLKTLFLGEIIYAMVKSFSMRFNFQKKWLLLGVLIFLIIFNDKSYPHFIGVNIVWPLKAWVFIEIGKILIAKKEILNKPATIVIFIILWGYCGLYLNFSFQDSNGINLIVQVILSTTGFVSFYTLSEIIKKHEMAKIITCHLGSQTLYIFFWHYLVFAIISAIYSLMISPDEYVFIKSNVCLNSIHWIMYVTISLVLIDIGTKIYCNVKKRTLLLIK